MKIKSLHLTNFRGFENLALEFPDRLTVFIGVNGAGKSAILRAIGLVLSNFILQMSERENDLFPFNFSSNDSDIKADSNAFSIKSSFSNNKQFYTKEFSYSNSVLKTNALDFQYVFSKDSNLPLLLLIHANRVLNVSVEVKNATFKLPQLNAYTNAFSSLSYNFRDFTDWFKIEEDFENEQIIATRNFNHRNPRLEAVRQSLKVFFSQLSNAQFNNLRIERDIKNPSAYRPNGVSRLVIDKNGQKLELEQLSDGEKMTLLLVADIARRLTIANPSLQNAFMGEGIVLIDEIDLHLHPQWQREIVPALLKTFTNLQFIVTTHSPQVLSKVNRENIFILENGGLVKNTPHTYGRNASAILFEIFGVTDRPIDVQAKIDHCAKLLDEGKYDLAKVLLAELTNLLGETDEAIVSVKTQLLFDNQLADL